MKMKEFSQIDWTQFIGSQADVLDPDHTPSVWLNECTIVGFGFLNPEAQKLPYLTIQRDDGNKISYALNPFTVGGIVFHSNSPAEGEQP